MVLTVSGLTKRFGDLTALDGVDLAVAPGEIHALLGENGAGKSTLVKTVFGLLAPDAGTMSLHGQPFAPASPAAARRAGIGLVFQHFSLFDAMTVAENIALGLDEMPGRLRRRIQEVSGAYGLAVDPDRTVGTLSVGERQRVEIVRALLGQPRVLIMDEPTSVLTPQEAAKLFGVLRSLAEDGVAILYISHKLEEIRRLCHAATVLRRGRVVGTADPRATTAAKLAEMMLGARVPAAASVDHQPGAVRLAAHRLGLPRDGAFGTALRDVGFDLRAGEILGIAGVAGNGQEDLVQALSGERPVAPAALTLDGAPIGALGPEARRRRGLLTLPGERLGHAAAPGMTLAENAAMTARRRRGLATRGLIRWDLARAFADDVVAAFDVRTPGSAAPAGALSGGNLQKFVVGREVLQAPDVLVVDQPTWGVDAAAVAAIHRALRGLTAQGAAVMVISQDLDELFALADRIAAIAQGRLSPARPASQIGMAELGRLMEGAA